MKAQSNLDNLIKNEDNKIGLLSEIYSLMSQNMLNKGTNELVLGTMLMQMNDCAEFALKNLNIVDMYLLDPIKDKPNVDFLDMESNAMIFANTSSKIIEHNVNQIETNINFAQPTEVVTVIESFVDRRGSFGDIPDNVSKRSEVVDKFMTLVQPTEVVTVTNTTVDRMGSYAQSTEMVTVTNSTINTNNQTRRTVRTIKEDNISDDDVNEFSFEKSPGHSGKILKKKIQEMKC